MSEENTCKNCVFFRFFERSTHHGRCRRYPPTVYACDENFSTNTIQPMVDVNDWCGEHPKDYIILVKGGENVVSD